MLLQLITVLLALWPAQARGQDWLRLLDFARTCPALTDWRDTKDHCACDGVQCNAGGRVTSIQLTNVNLHNCQFPASWKPDSVEPGMEDLRRIRIINCTNVDVENLGLAALTQLHSLGVSNLTGPLPPNLSALVSLSELHLDGNRLSGVIPTQYSALARLTVLNLNNNHGLCGPLPTGLTACSLGLNGTRIDYDCDSGVYLGTLRRHEARCVARTLPGAPAAGGFPRPRRPVPTALLDSDRGSGRKLMADPQPPPPLGVTRPQYPPRSWTYLLDAILEEPLQRVGRPLTMVLRSTVPSTNQGWVGSVQPGVLGQGAALWPTYDMQEYSNTSDDMGGDAAQWRFTVPGSMFTKTGNYYIYVYGKSGNAPVTVLGNGTLVVVYVGLPDTKTSALMISSTRGVVGQAIDVQLQLKDAFGNFVTQPPRNVSVTMLGSISRRTVIPAANFEFNGGTFTYKHKLAAQETLTLYLNISGTLASRRTVNVTGTIADVVDWDTSIKSAQMQFRGSNNTISIDQGSSLVGTALTFHRAYIPVARKSSRKNMTLSWFGADPGLEARVEVNGPSPIGGQTAVLKGNWSSTKRAYVVFFMAPAVGTFNITLSLWHPVTNPSAQASIAVVFNADWPVASKGILEVTANRVRVGDWVYLTAMLLNEAGYPTTKQDGVSLTATVNGTAVSDLPFLSADSSNLQFWSSKYTFLKEETVVFKLASYGVVVANQTVTVIGVTPSYLSLSQSLEAACVVNVVISNMANQSACGFASGPAGTYPSDMIRRNATLLVAKSQEFKLTVPVYTIAGEMWKSTDPQLLVQVSLLPSDKVKEANTTVLSGLALRRLMQQEGPMNQVEMVDTADESSATHARKLMQAYQSGYPNGIQPYDALTDTGNFDDENAGWEGYDLDAYELIEEPREPGSTAQAQHLNASAAPPLNVDMPDGRRPLYEQLTKWGIVTYDAGKWKDFYEVAIRIDKSDAYLAVLSVRHPNGTLQEITFWLNVIKPLETVSTRAAGNGTLSLDYANPKITFHILIPVVAALAYPGRLASLVYDYGLLMAARAGLPSSEYVIVDVLSGNPDAIKYNSVMLRVEVRFTADWRSVPGAFDFLTSLEWFYFRLQNQPSQLLTDRVALPSIGANNITVTKVEYNEAFVAAIAASLTFGPGVINKRVIKLSTDPYNNPTAITAETTAPKGLPDDILSSPPVLKLIGEPYLEVLEGQSYRDPGVYVFDAVDGSMVDVRVSLRLCVRIPELVELMYAVDAAATVYNTVVGTMNQQHGQGISVTAATASALEAEPPPEFTCRVGDSDKSEDKPPSLGLIAIYRNGAVGFNTNTTNAPDKFYLLSYIAINSRGIAATTRHRAVVVRPHCNTAAGEFWCTSISACSIGRLCFYGSTAATATADSFTNSGSPAASTAASTTRFRDVDPDKLAVIVNKDGNTVVISPDGTSVVTDPNSYTSTTFSYDGSSNSVRYGIIGDLMKFGSNSSVQSRQQPEYVRDMLAPLISLRGSGQPVLTAGGVAVMIDEIEVGADWIDAGAFAWDGTDGNITAWLHTYGGTALNTSRPTPSFSYIIEYQVADLAGNTAAPAMRFVRIVCPAKESYCIDADGLPACTSSKGVCGKPIPAMNITSSLLSDHTTLATAAFPTLRLIGPAVLAVLQGVLYDRCNKLIPQTHPCDPGATAMDKNDGNLEYRILVCGVPLWASHAGQTLLPLLLACNASTRIPGNYTLRFDVTNSLGRSATVARTLIVQPACPQGERLCSNSSCSVNGGICASDLLGGSANTSTSSRPVLTLVTAAAAPELVQLPRGQMYAPCEAGADLSASTTASCEPGAQAWDAVGVNLTDRVVVCPPANCLRNNNMTAGCSVDLLQRHTLAAKGLAGCGIDPLAPLGAIFSIDFWVWDDASPPNNASARRKVIITNPCAETEMTSYFCADGAGSYKCSPFPCSTLPFFWPPEVVSPNITLLPSNSPIFIEYGMPSPLYLGPCNSSSNTQSCGAIATGVSLPTSPGGLVTTTDLTAQILVNSTTACSSTMRLCPTCSLEILVATGNCLPGVYTYRYSVTDEQGAVSAADRTVVVYQHVTITGRLNLFEDKPADAAAMGSLLANMQNTSHPDYLQVLQNITSRLTAHGVSGNDIDIVIPNITSDGSLPTSLSVNVTVHVFNPPSVHRAPGNGMALTAASDNKYVARRLGALHGQDAELNDAQGVQVQLWEALTQQCQQELQYLLHEFEESNHDQHAQHGGIQSTTDTDQICKHLEPVDEHPARNASSPFPYKLLYNVYSLSARFLAQATASMASSNNVSLMAQWTSVADSLNATDIHLDIPPNPDLFTGYMAALPEAVRTLASSFSVLAADTMTLSDSIARIMADDVERVDDVASVPTVQSAVADLIGAAMSADNITLLRINQLLSLLDAQLIAEGALAAESENIILDMRDQAVMARTQADQALYSRLLAEETVQDSTYEVTDNGCYRLQQQGFRSAFTVAHFPLSERTVSTNTPHGSADSTSISFMEVGSRRLQQARSGGNTNSLSTYIPVFMLSPGNTSTHDSGSTSSELNKDGGDVKADMDVSFARMRHAGVGYDNHVIGGLMLHTTRRPIRALKSGVGPASSTRLTASSEDCSSTFSSLDARCYTDVIAYSRRDQAGMVALQRLLATTNMAPYGVDPVFLRASELYRPDLVSRLNWFYNTSDPDQISPTGAPYGFSARPLAGRTPGFPVLIESGLSAARAAQMIRYLADGNYLDHRQTLDMTAELLVYNPISRVFGYFRGDFTWLQYGGILGHLSTVGFPAMTIPINGQLKFFGIEVLPLWFLSVFFACTTVAATLSAAAHARDRVAVGTNAAGAALVQAKASKRNSSLNLHIAGFHNERAARGAIQARSTKSFFPNSSLYRLSIGIQASSIPGNIHEDGSSLVHPSSRPNQSQVHREHRIHSILEHQRTATARRSSAYMVPGLKTPQYTESMREKATHKVGQFELMGISGRILQAWLHEFLQHDGRLLLYDIALAVLLMTVAIFWAVYIYPHVVLYSARSSYRVYDAPAFASARWLMSARADPGSASDFITSAYVASAASLGLEAPRAPGDPGRWLLPSKDSEWDELNIALQQASRIVDLWTVYGMLQAITVTALVVRGIIMLAFQSRLGIISQTLMKMVAPIFHLVLIVVTGATMLATAANTVMGERYADMSNLSSALRGILSQVVQASQLNVDEALSKRIILSPAQRAAAVIIIAFNMGLLVFVFVNFFWVTIASIFTKERQALDRVHTTSVVHDVVHIVLPDLIRQVARALQKEASSSRWGKQVYNRADQRRWASRMFRALSAFDVYAVQVGPTRRSSNNRPSAPSNEQLLQILVAGGVHALMCTSEPQLKIRRSSKRMIKVGNLMVGHVTIRQLMDKLTFHTIAKKLELRGGRDARARRASTAALKEQQILALQATERIMECLGTAGGIDPRKDGNLEALSVNRDMTARRRGKPSAAAKRGVPVVALSTSNATKRGSQGKPIGKSSTRHVALSDLVIDVNKFAAHVMRWQTSVHRWQVRTLKQMAAAYLINQKLLSKMGKAPGPAFMGKQHVRQSVNSVHPSRAALPFVGQPALLTSSSIKQKTKDVAERSDGVTRSDTTSTPNRTLTKLKSWRSRVGKKSQVPPVPVAP